MCVIISKQSGQTIPDDILEDCYADNPDGFGVSWIVNGKLKIQKGLYGLKRIQRIVKKLVAFRAVLHFRWSTHGEISAENAHPFLVANGACAMVHNGILPIVQTHKAKSDTHEFAAHLQDWSCADIVRTREEIESWHGPGNRLLFLFADGTSLRTGSWQTFAGLQFSNLNWRILVTVPATDSTQKRGSSWCNWCCQNTQTIWGNCVICTASRDIFQESLCY